MMVRASFSQPAPLASEKESIIQCPIACSMLEPMEIKILGPDDGAALAAIDPDVFDDELDARATAEFLNDPRHHLVVAIDRGEIVGFASAVHYVHPDKPAPELWINEVGVATSHRGRGVAKAILQRLFEAARELGCVEAWVLTERANDRALRLYKSSGGIEAPGEQVMFTFRLEDSGVSDGTEKDQPQSR
jgi:ribosomal protein S18 acetylase RimI-like enzyme